MTCENREKNGGRVRDIQELNLERWRVKSKQRWKHKGREFGIPERSLEKKESR